MLCDATGNSNAISIQSGETREEATYYYLDYYKYNKKSYVVAY